MSPPTPPPTGKPEQAAEEEVEDGAALADEVRLMNEGDGGGSDCSEMDIVV